MANVNENDEMDYSEKTSLTIEMTSYNKHHNNIHNDMSNENEIQYGNETTNRGKLSLITFGIMIWIMVCGGPYGIELTIQSGGVFLTLVGLIITPLIFSLPHALVCAELNSIMPSNHGYILWVYRAFSSSFNDVKKNQNNNNVYGEYVSFLNALSGLACMGSDIPIYIVLAAEYFKELLYSSYGITLSSSTLYAIKFFVLVFGAVLNVLSIGVLGMSTIVFTI